MSSDQERLESILDRLIARLYKEAILPPLKPEEKMNLKTQVCNLIFNAHGNDLREYDYLRDGKLDPTMIKALTLTILSTLIKNQRPDLGDRLNPSLLFSKELIHTPDELKKELKKELKLVLSILMKLQPKRKQLSEEELDKEVDRLVNKLCDQFKDKNLSFIAKDDPTVEILDASYAALMALALRNLFGGVDPRYGGVAFPVTAITGNFAGLVDYGPGETSAAIDNASRVDPGYDPLGLELFSKLRKESLGALGEGLAEELVAEGLLTSASPQLTRNSVTGH